MGEQGNPQSCAPPGLMASQSHVSQPIHSGFVKLKIQIVCKEDIYAAFSASIAQAFRGRLACRGL